MSKKTVLILNYPSHYRLPIYKKINDELNADFYFGKIRDSSIKKLNYKELTNFKKEFKTINYGDFYWYLGSWKLVFGSYKNFILTGDPHILSNWLLMFFAKITNKRVLLWTHGWKGKEKGIRKIIKKLYFGLAHDILLYGDYAKELMIKEGFKKEKLVPIYNSLDYEKQLEIREGLVPTFIYKDYFKNDFPVLFFIGRIQPAKKLEMILDSMLQLEGEDIMVNFVIIGEEVDGYDFEQQVTNRKLNKRVWLYGPSYNENEIGNLIFNADMCISPGNIGLTAIHSLMYGKPVITHNNYVAHGPEFETIQEGFNGLYFEENNTDDLCDKIETLLKIDIKTDRCYKIIDEKWNPNNQIVVFESLFKTF